MTKRDYELIASVFHNTRAITDEESGMKDCLIDRMTDALARGNPAFNGAKFRKACTD